ncbi:MAG: hypothetical protein ABSD27_10845 [Bryobacteraceae bacterium]|jgi:hypothetical protein
MALFTDGAISTMEDMLAYESAILEVASTEGIDLTVKLRLGEEELAVELEAFLAWEGSGILLGQVVVTDPLRKWHLFRALSLVYRDAYNRQLNDRYEGKWKEYERLAQWAQQALYDTGVGVMSDPIPRASQPQVSQAPAAAAGATYYISVTWCGAGGEGAGSATVAFVAPDGTVAAVGAANAPANVTGWNVYAGSEPAELTLQNDVPLALGATWTAPPGGLRSGRALGPGQSPERYLAPGHVLGRG